MLVEWHCHLRITLMGQTLSRSDINDFETGLSPQFFQNIVGIPSYLWNLLVGSKEIETNSSTITHVNWNILAEGLTYGSGFVTPDGFPATKQFGESILKLVNASSELRSYEKRENCRELLECWLTENPEFYKYQTQIEKIFYWENKGGKSTDMDSFWKLESIDQLNTYLTSHDYPGRGPVFVKRLELLKPDIITMQEVDKYKYFKDHLVGYSSQVGNSHYTRLPLKEIAKVRGKNCLITKIEDYKSYLESKTHAFIPKLNSTCYSLNKSRAQGEACHDILEWKEEKDEPDDDGSCIFWRADRFDCLEVDYKMLLPDYENKKGIFKATGVVYAKLREQGEDGKIVHVFSTHLSSGNKIEEETRRIGEIHRVIDFIAEKTRGSNHGSEEQKSKSPRGSNHVSPPRQESH